MSNDKKFKKETMCLIDTMIKHADKGPSGFWVEDHEGCGNPNIFPEFEEGLRKGQLIQKNHFYCPWNTAIMYAEGRGNIQTGCYHSCSIRDAHLLSAEQIKIILERFKQRISSGELDNPEKIRPLLTKDEQEFIVHQKESARKENELRSKEAAQKRREVASKLLGRFTGDNSAQEIIAAHYGEKTSVMTYEFGCLQFSPESMKGIVGGENLTYDDYIELQIRSHGKTRTSFEQCYFELGLDYCGQIEKKTRDKICFKRILISGMYSDGVMFDGKEEHVWMDIHGFENFETSDCLTFGAEVYRYIKTGNGKVLDYGLRNPCNIKKIDNYKLPTDEELRAQALSLIECEVCCLNEHCNKSYCILKSRKKPSRRKGNSK